VNPSKTFNIAGVRTGAVITPNPSIREVYHESVVNNKAYGRTIFGTIPFEIAYNECDYYADQLLEYLEGNVKIMTRYFEEKIPKITMVRPEGTYLVWLDCRKLGLSPKELDKFMVEKAKVGLNEGSTFGASGAGFMRMNIACPRALLEEGLRRIESAGGGRL
jgi:cystathionine beta-lyase